MYQQNVLSQLRGRSVDISSLHGGQSKLKFDTIMSAKPKNKKPTD
jgi:hypothetical protein